MSAFFIKMDKALDGGFQPVKAIKLPNGKEVVVTRSPITAHCPEIAEDLAVAWAKEEDLSYIKEEKTV